MSYTRKEKEPQPTKIAALFSSCAGPRKQLTPCVFQFIVDSKTDSKTGGQLWISVDESRNSIGLWSGWKTVCDYSHFFAVRWTHKTAVKRLLHGSGVEPH